MMTKQICAFFLAYLLGDSLMQEWAKEMILDAYRKQIAKGTDVTRSLLITNLIEHGDRLGVADYFFDRLKKGVNVGSYKSKQISQGELAEEISMNDLGLADLLGDMSVTTKVNGEPRSIKLANLKPTALRTVLEQLPYHFPVAAKKEEPAKAPASGKV